MKNIDLLRAYIIKKMKLTNANTAFLDKQIMTRLNSKGIDIDNYKEAKISIDYYVSGSNNFLLRCIPFDAKVTLDIKELNHVLFDIDFKIFQIIRKSSNIKISKPYSFEDIKSYDLIIDNQVLVSKNTGMAKTIIGGVLFGPLGALAGSISSNTSTKETINSVYSLNLYLNDLTFPYVELKCKDRETALTLYETFKMWEEKCKL
jgi:hypothetical protein